MTRISKNTHLISGPAETLAQYTYIIPESDERFGIELEQAAIDRATLKPTPVPKALAVIANAAARGVEVLPEGTSAIFEVLNQTPFTAADGPAAAASDIARQRTALGAALKDEGQIALDYATIPFATLADTCRENLHHIPRVQIFVSGYFKHHRPDIGEYFTTCAGAQSSVTLATPLKRLAYFSRLSHLTPLLSILTATTPPFASREGQGAPTPIRSNIGLERRLHALGDPRNPDHLKNAFPGLGTVAALDNYSTLADIHYGHYSAAEAARLFATLTLKPALSRYPAFTGLLRICESGLTPALEARQTDGTNLAAFRTHLAGVPAASSLLDPGPS